MPSCAILPWRNACGCGAASTLAEHLSLLRRGNLPASLPAGKQEAIIGAERSEAKAQAYSVIYGCGPPHVVSREHLTLGSHVQVGRRPSAARSAQKLKPASAACIEPEF